MQYSDIKSIRTLAYALGVQTKQLTGLLYGIKIENCYTSFKISKKNGDERTINAPSKSLKYVQRRLTRLLVKRQEEFFLERNVKNNISHGFSKGKGIKTNAVPHRNKRYVLNVDLENFFETIHFGRVQGFFKNNEYFKLPEVATIIAQIACYEGSLPQGAPSSPIISNLICQILDYRIVHLCKKYRLTYTRYADDLTFSTNDKNFEDMKDEFEDELKKVISRSGFIVNSNKTRFQKNDSRQIVTGLSVNKKINVTRDFYKKTRSMADKLYRNGSFTINEKNGTIDQLEGRFSFINDLVKYNNRLDELNSLKSNLIEYKKNLLYTEERKYKNDNDNNQVLDWERNLGNLNIREKDFQKFLFYKYFIANPKVTVITEGKTDSRYIKSALREYYLEYPNLITKDEGGFKYNIHFLKPSKRLRYFFDYMSGGGGGFVLINLMEFFSGKDSRTKRNYIKYFNSILSEKTLPQKPTLFLVDNEWQGSNPLPGVIGKLVKDKNLERKDIEQKIKSDFLYHIDLNAFVITLPVESVDYKTNIEIENLFNLEEINNELIAPNYDGKIFDPKKKNGDNKKKIGKEIFSNYILSNYDSEVINYSKFKPLLDLINKLSEDYTKFKDNK